MAVMSDATAVSGVLITGPYGVGKSSVAVELVTLLEEKGSHYGLVDVDFLGWFDVGAGDGSEVHRRTRAANVTAVVGNFRAAGVRRFILPRSVRDHTELSEIAEAAGIPLRVAALRVPLAVVERRLSADPTEARQDDLRVARQWYADGIGEGLAEIVLDNDRPIRTVATELLAWLGW
jgi:hypothetical protein